MKYIPTTTDAIALTGVISVTFGLFVAGLFDVLDNFIVQAVLFLSFGALFIVAIRYALKNESKKNRLEEIPQDDLH